MWRGRSPGCLQLQLGGPKKELCQSLLEPGGKSAEQSVSVSHPGSDSPSVEVKPWCPTLLEIVVDFPTSHQNLNTPRMHSRGDASISRLVYPRHCNQDKVI